MTLSGGYDAKRAESDLDAGKGDLIAIGIDDISSLDEELAQSDRFLADEER